MTDNKSTHWSVTINNPTSDEYAQIDEARAKGWKVEGQLEKGEEGTPHLQLAVKTPHIRFGAVKKQFPRSHIEAARNPSALAAYVRKDETRVAELPGKNEMYPGMNKFFHLITHILAGEADKDGLDVCSFADGEVLMYRDGEKPSGDRLLELLDFATRFLVRYGWHVEHYAVNPAVRSSWKKFGCEMLLRAADEMKAEKDAAAAAAAAARSDIADANNAVVHTLDAISEVQVPVQAPPRDPPSPSSDGSQAP